MRDTLIEDNLGLVRFVIAKYYPTYLGKSEYEDVFQEGCMGLIRAAEVFDENKGAFSTLATMCIRRNIAMYYRKNTIQSAFRGLLR